MLKLWQQLKNLAQDKQDIKIRKLILNTAFYEIFYKSWYRQKAGDICCQPDWDKYEEKWG